MSAVKKVLRRLMLGKLKQRALEDPARVTANSLAVCDQLWHRTILPMYQNTSKSASTSTNTATTRAETAMECGTVLAYLPMFYEVDLRPLMKRIWEHNHEMERQQFSTATRAPEDPIVVMVPHTVDMPPTSASLVSASGVRPGGGLLVFVELPSADVATRTFVPHGKLQYMDLTEQDRDALYAALRDQVVASFGEDAQRVASSENDVIVRGYFTSPTSGARLSYLCSASAAVAAAGQLASNAGAASLLAAEATGAPSPPALAGLVVLAPAAAFDEHGQRLGKGGGFYDRFLATARQTFAHCRRGVVPVHAVGVAFDEQVVPSRRASTTVESHQDDSVVVVRCSSSSATPEASSESDDFHKEIPTEVWDQRMDVIVTPTRYIDIHCRG